MKEACFETNFKQPSRTRTNTHFISPSL